MTADQRLAAYRAEGLTVHEHTGWRTHNRDAATGRTFGPVYGVLIHHTAGHGDKELCYNGRADLPGPLCHNWLGKTAGLWMIGHGRANHAGAVDGNVIKAVIAQKTVLPKDTTADTDGNDCLYGLEIENLGNGTDPYPDVQYHQAVLWAAAHCRFHGWTERSVVGHKEVQPGKIDPSFDMDTFRADVKKQLATKPGGATAAAGTPSIDLSNVVRAFTDYPSHPATGSVKTIQRALTAEALYNHVIDGVAGPTTKKAYAAWQKRLGYSGTAADGVPGATSLKKLAAKRGFTVTP